MTFLSPAALGFVVASSWLLLVGLDAQGQSQGTARPQGWSTGTHGDNVTPDYGRLFALDR